VTTEVKVGNGVEPPVIGVGVGVSLEKSCIVKKMAITTVKTMITSVPAPMTIRCKLEPFPFPFVDDI
jgi:hypothetical protein